TRDAVCRRCRVALLPAHHFTVSRVPELSGPVRKYDAFRRARPASAGARQAHTCHQHASACRAPADTTRTPPGYAPYLRTEPLRVDSSDRLDLGAPHRASDALTL